MIDANIKSPSIFTKFFLFSSMSHNYQTSFKFLNLQSPRVQTTSHGKNTFVYMAIKLVT